MSAARLRLAETIRSALPSAPESLINAFATVPRERFLPPGPWQVRDASGTRLTDDANPDRVYADTSIAVDAARDLYNGQPGTVARWLDALAIAEGDRVLHIGSGSGYYSAILAATVGERGHVTAIEVDEGLSHAAATNLTPWPWVHVRHGDGTTDLPTDIDVAVIHAGASHVRPEWLDCARSRGRLLVPLTVDFAAMGPTLGKGLAFVLHRLDGGWSARALSFVAIYSMQSARDASMATTFGQAMQRGGWDGVSILRTDAHEPGASCWCHWETGPYCLSSRP
jgi:protein-L-isoaspartate(D-aspartate) O-methyltransferase